jgi:hypothetical protein
VNEQADTDADEASDSEDDASDLRDQRDEVNERAAREAHLGLPDDSPTPDSSR